MQLNVPFSRVGVRCGCRYHHLVDASAAPCRPVMGTLVRVNYDQIGVKFMTWDAWQAQTTSRPANDVTRHREPPRLRFMNQATARPCRATCRPGRKNGSAGGPNK